MSDAKKIRVRHGSQTHQNTRSPMRNNPRLYTPLSVPKPQPTIGGEIDNVHTKCENVHMELGKDGDGYLSGKWKRAFTIRLDDYTLGEIKRFSEKYGMTPASMARLCIEKSIQRNNGLTIETAIEDDTYIRLSEKADRAGMSINDYCAAILEAVSKMP